MNLQERPKQEWHDTRSDTTIYRPRASVENEIVEKDISSADLLWCDWDSVPVELITVDKKLKAPKENLCLTRGSCYQPRGEIPDFHVLFRIIELGSCNRDLPQAERDHC